MKVLFLNPPFKKNFSRTSRNPAVTRSGTIYYPFWLAYAAGLLDRAGVVPTNAFFASDFWAAE